MRARRFQLWSPLPALGNGSLSDADALCGDFAALAGLGLGEVPTSRRLGEILA